uniref:Uncharacterized protein n=1 Tax=Anguilla anguilla TaxID=7936 RepID=A0A0E9R765_ANGAN
MCAITTSSLLFSSN